MTHPRLFTSAPKALLALGLLAATAGFASLGPVDSAHAAAHSVAVGDNPSTVAVDTRTGAVVTVSGSTDRITVVSNASGTPSTKIVKVGVSPSGVAIDSATHRIFVSNLIDGTVRIIDGNDLSAPQTVVNVGKRPMGVAVDPVSHAVYVANNGDATVSEFDGTPGATITVYTQPVGTNPVGVAIDSGTDPKANNVYVVDNGDDTVSSFARGIGVVHTVTTVKVGKSPLRVAVDQVNHSVYVTNNNDNTVSSFNGAAATPLVATKKVGTNPLDVAVDSVTHEVYVTNFTDNTVTQFGGTSTTETVSVGLRPNGIAFDPRTQTVFLALSGESTLSWFPAVSFPTITGAALPDAIQGSAYSFQLQASGTPAPLFAIISSKTSVAPAGLSIDPSTGLLTGPVTGAPGTYTFQVVADNGTNNAASAEFTLVVKAAASTPAPTPVPTTSSTTAPTATHSGGGSAGGNAGGAGGGGSTGGGGRVGSGTGTQLASTGSDALSSVPLAVCLLLLGAAAMVRVRRIAKRERQS